MRRTKQRNDLKSYQNVSGVTNWSKKFDGQVQRDQQRAEVENKGFPKLLYYSRVIFFPFSLDQSSIKTSCNGQCGCRK